MWVSFSNNIDIEVRVDPLFDDFKSNSIAFLFFPSLGSYSRISIGPIYYIPNLFLLEYSLRKISLLRLMLEVMELFSLTLTIVVFICHFDNNLEKNKKCNTSIVEVYNRSYNLMKSLI